MDKKALKKRVAEIRKATGTKHPKTLIVELCGLLDTIIDHLDRKIVASPPLPRPTLPDYPNAPKIPGEKWLPDQRIRPKPGLGPEIICGTENDDSNNVDSGE